MYGAAKAAFTVYLSGLRNRLHRSDIQVLTVLPGFINTKMTEAMNLPGALTTEPDEAAEDIYSAFKKRERLYIQNGSGNG